jgi:hypothetical protein
MNLYQWHLDMKVPNPGKYDNNQNLMILVKVRDLN